MVILCFYDSFYDPESVMSIAIPYEYNYYTHGKEETVNWKKLQQRIGMKVSRQSDSDTRIYFIIINKTFQNFATKSSYIT